MFWGFGMPSFNAPPPQQPPQQQNPLAGIFGGFSDFLNNSFMHPLFGPNQEEQQAQRAQQQAQQRPTFTRSNKRQSQKEKEQPKKKEKKEEFPVGSGPYWKQQGNLAFQKEDYKAAIECYSKAIVILKDKSQNDTESVYYSNRARCFKQIGQLENALKDAQAAIQLDEKNIKGHLLSGQILAEMGKADDNTRRIEIAITRMTKALTLCTGQKKPQFQQQLNINIYRAKKLLWYKQFEMIRQARINAITEYKVVTKVTQKYLQADQTIKPQQVQRKLNQFLKSTNENVQLQIPDYFCCKITLDLMEDPVVTDAGQTYEKSVIEEHIERNGKTDPFTREPISGKLYPNMALKRAIQAFIDQNPWSYQFRENEDYRKISF